MNKPLLRVLKVGKSVENPVLWKKIQLYITVLGTALPLLALCFPFLQVLIDKDILAKTLTAIAMVNVTLTVATTDKIGL
ncbi:MAG: hypothetical protein QX189_04540 [Methylococcales bacterium]